jgi:hypothetical protein
MHAIKEWLTSYPFTLLALYTYWIPLAVCSVVYVVRCARLYRADVKASKEEYYVPRLTVGYILCHVIITILPGVNIFAMVLDCAASVFEWLGDVMDVPLVRKRNKS